MGEMEGGNGTSVTTRGGRIKSGMVKRERPLLNQPIGWVKSGEGKIAAQPADPLGWAETDGEALWSGEARL
jgi:hypothetical protein